MEFESRRPDIVVPHAAVSCAQPLASKAGLDILEAGGNAADAAVAIAAALNVTQPCSTGIGGDAFCLFYDAKTRKVHGLNGSGRSPGGLTLDKAHADGFGVQKPFPVQHGHTVTVPGAAAAWVDTVHKFGSKKLSLQEILRPAIRLAENGFPVSQTASFFWDKGSQGLLTPKNIHGKDLLVEGQRAPRWGETFKNPHLAKTFQRLAAEGKSGFYEGEIAEAIVEAVRSFGGVMTLEDLKNHETTFEDPISVAYKGVRLWEIVPNGQGIVALLTLNILQSFDLQSMGHNSGQYLHTLIEAVRLAFADGMQYIADMSKHDVPVMGMLSPKYADERRKLISPDKAKADVKCGNPWNFKVGKDTVYLTAVDADGNACSFINSNYMGFGSAIVPRATGFSLQNRGSNFSLEEGHPNALAPNKRPYHTIIPAMLTNDNSGELLASYGVMGGFMQPQGHVQVLLNMLEFGMSPQQALDKPRFCVGPGHLSPIGSVSLEEGIPPEIIEELRARGHLVSGPVSGQERALFGRGHVISRGAWWSNCPETIANDPSVLWAASDPRADGIPMGF